jgi:hypothetical protein
MTLENLKPSANELSPAHALLAQHRSQNTCNTCVFNYRSMIHDSPLMKKLEIR